MFLYRVSVAGAASLAVIPVSREPRDSIRIHAGAIGVALKPVERGGLGTHVEGESANLNRLGEEYVDRIRQANSPACVDGCGVGLDLCGRAGLHLGGDGRLSVLRAGRSGAVESTQEHVEPERGNQVSDGEGMPLLVLFRRFRGDELLLSRATDRCEPV